MRILLTLLFLILATSCNKLKEDITSECKLNKEFNKQIRGALLASRISSLEELKSIIEINYYKGSSPSNEGNIKNTKVKLTHCSGGKKVKSILEAGISQVDITEARDGGVFDKLKLLYNSPFSVANRMDLVEIYTLARWDHDEFGWHDVAFYNLAVEAEKKILSKNTAYKTARDSSEKGYINTFNHITAQAIITSCYSETIADFIADVHELYNMPELTSGNFSDDQLSNPIQNPVDNYVDMINNEWGQEIGKKLREKYSIDRHTIWTTALTTDYLNELQEYYSWAFQISMGPFKKSEESVKKFTAKINHILHD